MTISQIEKLIETIDKQLLESWNRSGDGTVALRVLADLLRALAEKEGE